MPSAVARWSARGSALPDVTRGALYLMSAGFFFALMTSAIRPAAAELHPFQIVFIRNLLCLVFISPWLFRARVNLLESPQLKLHLLRATLFGSSMMCWFTAITMLPLVDAVSLNFTAPIFVTIMASLILRETVRLRRWTAVAVGFCGMLVIVRPGFQEFNLGHLLVMGDAIIWATAVILVRILSRREPPIVIVAHMFVWVTPLSLVPALFVWVWPSPVILLWMVAMAACSTCGHVLATRAYAAAEASAVMPFDYVRLIFFATAGYVFFSEVPDEWTLAGAAIIVSSSLYIMRREAALARARAAADRAADGEEDDN